MTLIMVILPSSSTVLPRAMRAAASTQLRLTEQPLVQAMVSITRPSRNLREISMVSPQLPVTVALPSGSASGRLPK
jgi:hypothetical protein